MKCLALYVSNEAVEKLQQALKPLNLDHQNTSPIKDLPSQGILRGRFFSLPIV
jgi:hypothetical protein